MERAKSSVAEAEVPLHEACAVLNDALLSPRLTDHAEVACLVRSGLKLLSTKRVENGRLSGAQGLAGDAEEPEWVGHATERTWEVLETLRSAIGDWHLPEFRQNAQHAATAQGQPEPQTPRQGGTLSHVGSPTSEGHLHGHHSIARRPSLAFGTQGRRSSIFRGHGTPGGARSPRSPRANGPDDAAWASPRGGSPRSMFHRRASHAPSSTEPGWHHQEEAKFHRVLYRPGKEGTPFHTLMLEGMLKGSVGTGLAVCWEAPFFKQWWPSFSVPPFHVTDSKVVAELSKGHNLSVTRLKVPWPFAPRELALSSLVAIVDRQSGIVLVTIQNLPEDPAQFREAEDGFPPELVPKVPNGTVRMDVYGGYVFKYLTPTTCYFRAFCNVDVKLEIVPPWVINFINRTLAGAGFIVLNQVVMDAMAGKKGIGASFQKLLQQEHSLYKEVDTELQSRASPSAPLEHATPGSLGQQAPGTTPRPLSGQDSGVPAKLQVRTQVIEEVVQGDVELLAARDPELHNAFATLEEAIRVFRTEGVSAFSEMPPASGPMAAAALERNRHLETSGAVDDLGPELDGVTEGRSKAKWWKRMRPGKRRKDKGGAVL